MENLNPGPVFRAGGTSRQCGVRNPGSPAQLMSVMGAPAVLQGEYLGQKVAVKNIKCDVTAQAFLDETAVMT